MESMSALAQGHKQIYRRRGLNPRDAVRRSRGQSFAAALEIDLRTEDSESTLRAYLHMVQPTEYHDGGMVSKVPMPLWGHAALYPQEEPHMTRSALHLERCLSATVLCRGMWLLSVKCRPGSSTGVQASSAHSIRACEDRCKADTTQRNVKRAMTWQVCVIVMLGRGLSVTP
jgi:hypothetical protein